VISNSGYTVERAVLGKDVKYNDVANWRYSELPNVFSREKKVDTYVVQTSSELQKVLDAPHSGMVFVESVMDKYDAPPLIEPLSSIKRSRRRRGCCDLTLHRRPVRHKAARFLLPVSRAALPQRTEELRLPHLSRRVLRFVMRLALPRNAPAGPGINGLFRVGKQGWPGLHAHAADAGRTVGPSRLIRHKISQHLSTVTTSNRS
jgi:hypothetical protein